MAAADLSRSRAAASRSTKGLFFISTLLCLLCFVTSSIDSEEEDQLETLKKTSEELQQHVLILKVAYKSEMASTEILSNYLNLIDPLIISLKKNKLISNDYPAVDYHAANIKAFMEFTKAKIDTQNENIREAIEEKEVKVMIYQNLITLLEKQQAGLASNSSEEVDE